MEPCQTFLPNIGFLLFSHAMHCVDDQVCVKNTQTIFLTVDLSVDHPGQDWFIIHVKLGHSMDNGFIFKKINKN